MTPDADLYRRAAARCITTAAHLDADQLPPCNACLLAIASTDTGGLPALAGAVDGVPGYPPGPPATESRTGDFTSRRKGGDRVTGSEAGCYYVVANDFAEWLVVGIPVAGGDAWVQARWDDRDVAVADAERWNQLAAAVSAS